MLFPVRFFRRLSFLAGFLVLWFSYLDIHSIHKERKRSKKKEITTAILWNHYYYLWYHFDYRLHFANFGRSIAQTDKFRPLHLRYLGYDNSSQDFKLFLDKGDTRKEDLENKAYLEENTQTLLRYFFIGLSLPNDKFWVNLRPDSPDNILDPDLERTDIGRIFLEADLQLKKDTASFTSPQTPEGKAYWDKLYKKAGELFGSENITIPTLTRPWIVPNEIIIRESPKEKIIFLLISIYHYDIL